MPDITITLGCEEQHRPRLAAIYWQAFGRKFPSVFRNLDEAAGFLAPALNLDRAFVAFVADEPVGVAGFKHGEREFVGGSFGGLRRHVGLPRALWATVLAALLYRRRQPDQLLMDGIAVEPGYRGQGVGSRLLDAVMGHATRLGLQAVRLDVVDTNPKARRLYERLGFVAIATESTGPLKSLFGFGAATTMVKKVSGGFTG